MFGKTFENLCTPAMIYLAISLFVVLGALFKGIKIMAVLAKTLFILFWTFILNFLCEKGYKSLSWFLVLLPYFLMLFGFLTAYFQIHEGFEEMGVENPAEATSELVSSVLKEKEDKKEGFKSRVSSSTNY
jgi:hypothetical protein